MFTHILLSVLRLLPSNAPSEIDDAERLTLKQTCVDLRREQTKYLESRRYNYDHICSKITGFIGTVSGVNGGEKDLVGPGIQEPLEPHQDTRATSGYQRHIRIPEPHYDTRATSEYQSHIRIPEPHYDTKATSGYQIHIRIPEAHQDTRATSGYQSHIRIPEPH
ncbi:hypothetical protein Btru_076717 [Bulinus truncatus]|nr:hypothetical protein Btru_076717 [Bulinus truncatus]